MENWQNLLSEVQKLLRHQPTPEEVEKYLEQVSAVAETMIPNILNRKEAVTTEDKKVFEFLQGHIKQALTAKKW